MKTKNENFAKKINLSKMKIASLSRAEKNQVLGGASWAPMPSWFCEKEEEEEEC
ncbi:class I lanthipeptide [uncultured Aquimarina sp.]|uniref:class I lanthipeptide n=1 Tax=uncultured Aquimarina sp. TaxID=575652 RepID=UPI002610CF39|nr:class I lanthipeptide [uncultured Aquimarina sp.]